VLGQDLAQQREHVDLAHAGVGLVAADLEPPVGEVDVAPEHRSGCRRPPAAQQQRGERRAPAGGIGGMALRPAAAPSVRDVDHRLAAIELAGGLEKERDLLGAVEVDRAPL
jgi:hypothetical protein